MDFAGEIDSKFAVANRRELLQAFDITEGIDSLGKAKVNITLFKALINYGA